MTTLRILTAFANTHAAEARCASGFSAEAAYVYEHESAPGRDMRPCRAFNDSNGTYTKEGRGFPLRMEPFPDLSAVDGAEVLCLNAEFYGPEWAYVKPPMRAIGLDIHNGDQSAAQEALIDKLQGFAREGSRVAKACGLYGFAPLEGTSDARLRVLMHCSAYMPAVYAPNAETFGVPEYRTRWKNSFRMMPGFPRKEIIPVLWGGYVYEPGLVTTSQWCHIFDVCQTLGASRAILWGDCAALGSIDHAQTTAGRMREAAKAMAITLE